MRTLTTGARTVLAGAEPVLGLLLELLTTPTVRLCTFGQPIDWNGHTWLAAGSLGQVEPVRDSAGAGDGLRFTLTHVPPEYLSLALGTSVRNDAANLYLAILNPATHASEDVSLVGAYVLDQTSIVEGVGEGALGVTALPLSSVFARPKPLRYTDADQQRLYPGDKSLQYVVSQSTHKDVWPAASYFRR